MLSLICFMCPSIISLQSEIILLSKKTNYINMIMNYGIYVLLNNTITITILTIFFGITYNYPESLNIYPGITVKYACISMIVAIILSVLKVIIIKNIGVTIEVKNKTNN